MFAGRDVGKSALAGEDREGLEVVRVRKEVEELELREMQALGREPAHVPEERRRIAGKVSYRSNGALPESLDESGRESPPRRIEDDPIGGGEPRASGVGRSIASQEADASGEALCDGALGVLARVVEGEPMGFDADDARELSREREGEEADPGKQVEPTLGFPGCRLGHHARYQLLEQETIRLKKAPHRLTKE
jgi:hypothetical protein